MLLDDLLRPTIDNVMSDCLTQRIAGEQLHSDIMKIVSITLAIGLSLSVGKLGER